MQGGSVLTYRGYAGKCGELAEQLPKPLLYLGDIGLVVELVLAKLSKCFGCWNWLALPHMQPNLRRNFHFPVSSWLPSRLATWRWRLARFGLARGDRLRCQCWPHFLAVRLPEIESRVSCPTEEQWYLIVKRRNRNADISIRVRKATLNPKRCGHQLAMAGHIGRQYRFGRQPLNVLPHGVAIRQDLFGITTHRVNDQLWRDCFPVGCPNPGDRLNKPTMQRSEKRFGRKGTVGRSGQKCCARNSLLKFNWALCRVIGRARHERRMQRIFSLATASVRS